jgi:hypothetical protein
MSRNAYETPWTANLPRQASRPNRGAFVHCLVDDPIDSPTARSPDRTCLDAVDMGKSTKRRDLRSARTGTENDKCKRTVLCVGLEP